MDIYEKKNIKPMLIAEMKDAFDSPDYIYELKLDGVRCIAYLDNGSTELLNKRNLRVSPIYPELNDINKQVNKRCILDGELVVINNGKPNFSEMQRRALMNNKFHIEMATTLVCTVKYMEKTESGSLRQPVFKGLRDDKQPKECIEKQCSRHLHLF